MKYILYEKESGRILHAHQSFRLGDDTPTDPTEEEIRLVMARFGGPETVGLAKTDMPEVSSDYATMSVNVGTGEVMLESLQKDALSARLRELKGDSASKET